MVGNSSILKSDRAWKTETERRGKNESTQERQKRASAEKLRRRHRLPVEIEPNVFLMDEEMYCVYPEGKSEEINT